MMLRWRDIGPEGLSHIRFSQTATGGVQVTATIHSVETGIDLVTSYPLSAHDRMALAILLLEGVDNDRQ